MRAVVQRVSSAKVEVEGAVTGEIGRGMLILLGVANGDTGAEVDFLVEKLSGLRIFPDDEGKMNLSVQDIGGRALVVSQFTLLGETRKGKRPNFGGAAPPALAEALYQEFVAKMRGRGITTATGVFGAMMAVSLVNDGPVTLIVDTPAATVNGR